MGLSKNRRRFLHQLALLQLDDPVCTRGGGLSTWVAATHAVLSSSSEAERSKLLFANAQRLWSL